MKGLTVGHRLLRMPAALPVQCLMRRSLQACSRPTRSVTCKTSSGNVFTSDLLDSATPDEVNAEPLVSIVTRRSTQTIDAGLHIVPTPIGNLEDITLRAIRVLNQVSTILAEDTRHTRKLLVHFGIQTPLLSLHEHNERSRISQILQQLDMGASLALVSDAGMPAISDPGAQLVSAAIQAGHRVIPLPGPNAATSALVASGLPSDDFRFLGFLPPKSGTRQKQLQTLAGLPSTLLFYVPPHGLAAVLKDASTVLGGARRCVIARELTKVNEQFDRCLLEEAAQKYAGQPVKGEITLLIEGAAHTAAAATSDDLIASVQKHLQDGLSASAAAKAAAAECRVSKNQAYSIVMDLKQQQQQQEGT